MSTIAVVRKGGIAAIAADTLTTGGPCKDSAAYVVNHEKIVRVGPSYLGIAGDTSVKLVLANYFRRLGKAAQLDNVGAIFETWRTLHAALKEDYFLRPEEEQDDDFESSRMDVLIAGPRGIFGVFAHRAVQEYTRFYACGMGSAFAMGAMYAAYDREEMGAEEIARRGIEAAAEFDESTGLPVTSYTVALES